MGASVQQGIKMTHYLGDGDLTFEQLIKLFREGNFPSGSTLQKDEMLVWPKFLSEEERADLDNVRKFFDKLFKHGEWDE